MDDTQLLVQMLQENASALGIKWQLRPATITGVADASTVVSVRVDGDADNGIVHAMTLIGPVAVGVRVMCLIIPHEIIYIIGQLNNTDNYRLVDVTQYGTGTTTVSLSDTVADGIRAFIIKFQDAGAGSGGVAASGGGTNVAMAGGGGGGGYIEVFVRVADLSNDLTITVGAAGTGGVAGNNAGNPTGASSCTDGGNFALTITAPTGGGGGGGSAAAGFGGGGGTGGSIVNAGTVGTVLLQAEGGDGGSAIRQAGFYGQQGYGGSSHCAGSQRSSTTLAGSIGASGSTFGGGAAGAYDGSGNTARAGGTGGGGAVWVERLR